MTGARRIHGRSVLLQLELGLSHGVGHEVLAALGLDPAALARPDAMAPEAAVYAHLERVAAVTAFEPFAVELAERHALTSLGLVGVAARHAPDARAAFAAFARYQHLVNELATHQLHELDEEAVWSERRHAPPSRGAALAAEISVATSVHIMRQAIGERFVPTFVELVREGGDGSAYARFFGRTAVWGAPRARFGFPRRLLDRAMPTADPAALAELSHVLAARDAARARTPAVVDEVRRVVTPALARGAPSLAVAARALHTSPRTLQRRLTDASTTYAEVVDGLRHELARAYLRRPELSVAEVAYLLGYREAAAFHRAFRRWTGRTPDAVRRASS